MSQDFRRSGVYLKLASYWNLACRVSELLPVQLRRLAPIRTGKTGLPDLRLSGIGLTAGLRTMHQF